MDNSILKDIFTERAEKELISIYQENSVPKAERSILLDVNYTEESGVVFQLASVHVEDDGIEDTEHLFFTNESTGITVFLAKNKLSYFKDLEIDFDSVKSDTGEESFTFIFKRKD